MSAHVRQPLPTPAVLWPLRALRGVPAVPAVPVAVLLVLVVLAWVAGDRTPPREDATGLWPIGLATGAAILSPTWLRRVVVLGAGAIALVTVAAGDAPVALAIGYGLTVSAEIWVAARVLRRADGRRPALRTDDDLRRYFSAAALGALVGAAGVATSAAVAGVGDVGRTALAVGAAHVASQLYFVPLFLRLPVQGAIGRRGERVLQWVVLLVATPFLLLSEASPSLVFLTIPILAWGALRISPLESLAQLVGVVGSVIVLTSVGHGPYADAAARLGVADDFRGVLLSAYAATCAIMVVPLVLRVGEYVGVARAAAAERDLVRGIVDGATGIAIIGTDPVGRITLYNPGAERLLGYQADEVLGRRSRTLYTPEAIADKAAELGVVDDFAVVAETIMERHLVGTLMRMRRKDGVERVHATTVARLTVAGVTSGYVSTSEDVTDQLDTEQALREALEFEHRAVERLEAVDAVKDQFVSTVSHELRTPITSILGYLELLADGTLGDLEARQVDALLRVQSNSSRLLALIDDLLTLSRVAESGIGAHEESFDLRDAVRAAHDVVAPAWARPRRLDVTVRLPDEPVPSYGSRELVERLVVNLLGNAAKFTDDGGTVAVSVLLDPGARQSVLCVQDTGIGIPVEEQGRLFTRFFRSSLAEGRAIPGSGLGLSIAQAVAEQHGGSIAVTSSAGKGTTVEVRLPVRPGMSKIQLPLDQATHPA